MQAIHERYLDSRDAVIEGCRVNILQLLGKEMDAETGPEDVLRFYDDSKGWLAGQELSDWRQVFFQSLGLKFLPAAIRHIGAFEYVLRLSLYPTWGEVMRHAKGLVDTVVGHFNMLQKQEARLVMYSFFLKEPDDARGRKNFKKNQANFELAHRHYISAIKGLVEYYYQRILDSVSGGRFVDWLCCCCHSPSEDEQKIHALKQAHLDRINRVDLIDVSNKLYTELHLQQCDYREMKPIQPRNYRSFHDEVPVVAQLPEEAVASSRPVLMPTIVEALVQEAGMNAPAGIVMETDFCINGVEDDRQALLSGGI